jgi:hypothetical protein
MNMNGTVDNNQEPDESLAPYLYLQNPGVNSFEELIVRTFARLVYEKHGVRILGF